MNDERPLNQARLEGVHHSSFIVHHFLIVRTHRQANAVCLEALLL